MSAQENTATTRRWFTEGWTGNMTLAEEIIAPSFSTNGIVVGPAGPKRNIANRLTGFPDVQTTVEEVIAEGDEVVIRVLWRGTHTGAYSGVPATSKSVAVRVISIWRFEDGKVVEKWRMQDQFSLLQQVGAISPAISGAQVPVPADSAPCGAG